MPRADDRAPARNRSVRAVASVVAVFLVSYVVAACGVNEQGSGAGRDGTSATPEASKTASDGRTPSPKGSRKPSSTATGGTPTVAELAKDPCRVIDDEDARVDKLWIGIDGTETTGSPKGCQWGARGGLVTFTLYPSTDQTKAEKFQHLTRKTVSGNKALLGSITDHGTEASVMVVSIGRNQSFMLMVIPFKEDAPGPDPPTLATNFAKAILSNLP